MTIQLPFRVAATPLRPRPDSSTRWLTPTAGLWVATRHGEHAGMVERVDGAYHAENDRGRSLGWFPDLDLALAAVEGGAKVRDESPRRLRAALWALNGAAVVAATAVAIAFIR